MMLLHIVLLSLKVTVMWQLSLKGIPGRRKGWNSGPTNNLELAGMLYGLAAVRFTGVR